MRGAYYTGRSNPRAHCHVAEQWPRGGREHKAILFKDAEGACQNQGLLGLGFRALGGFWASGLYGIYGNSGGFEGRG